MDVSTGDGSRSMLRIEEGTLHQHDLTVLDEVEVKEAAKCGVSREGDQRRFDLLLYGYALLLELDKLRTALAGKLGLEFVAFLDECIAQRSGCVVDVERSNDEPASGLCPPQELDVLEVFNAADFSGRGMPLDLRPDVHESLNGLRERSVNDNPPRCVTDEVPLREVVGDPGCVVHVAVGDAYVVYGDDLSWRAADVETDVELRRGDDRFLAREGESEDTDARNVFFDESAHLPALTLSRQ